MMKWKCATTKYVSVVAWSNGIAANMIPDRPPMTKNVMKPPMKRSGARNSGRPIITVAVQPKIWIVDGVPEEPEQVLPEQRAPPAPDVEEVELQAPLQLEQDAVERQRRQREDQRERHGEDCEAEERHPVQRHPRRAQLEDRGDEVDRRD